MASVLKTIVNVSDNTSNTNKDWWTVSYTRAFDGAPIEVQYTVNCLGEVHIKQVCHYAVDLTVLEPTDNTILKNQVTGDVLDIADFEDVMVSGTVNVLKDVILAFCPL